MVRENDAIDARAWLIPASCHELYRDGVQGQETTRVDITAKAESHTGIGPGSNKQ